MKLKIVEIDKGHYRVYEMVNRDFAKRVLSLREICDTMDMSIELESYNLRKGYDSSFHLDYKEENGIVWMASLIQTCLDAGHEVFIL